MDISEVNLILSHCLLRSARKAWKSSSEWAQMRKTSSMYLTHRVGFLGLFSRNVSPICPIYMVANVGASLVPIASPHVCVKRGSSNLNKLFLVRISIGRVGTLLGVVFEYS